VTGATAALLELNNSSVVRLSSVMNNPLDGKGLQKFKSELQYLAEFLDTQIEVQYASPEIRKLSRQIDLIKSNAVEPLKRSYKCDIEGLTDEQKQELMSRIEKDIEHIAETSNSTKTVVNSFRKFDGSPGVVTLGDYELKILLHYKQYYKSVLKTYIRLIKLNSFKEISVFGEKLHRIASLGPGFLLSVVERMFSATGANKAQLRNVGLEGVEILRLHYPNTEQTKSSSIFTVSDAIGGIDFKKYLISSMGLSTVKLDLSEIPEKVQYLSDLFDDQSKEFVDIMQTLLGRGVIDSGVAEEITQLYYKLFRLDNDYEFLCAQLFPEEEGIILGKEELEGVFNRLHNVGFCMFTLVNSKLLVESLKKLSFSSESRTVIDPDFEKNNLTFSRVIDLIETFCLDITPAV
jgi:hypothetical protein